MHLGEEDSRQESFTADLRLQGRGHPLSVQGRLFEKACQQQNIVEGGGCARVFGSAYVTRCRMNTDHGRVEIVITSPRIFDTLSLIGGATLMNFLSSSIGSGSSTPKRSDPAASRHASSTQSSPPSSRRSRSAMSPLTASTLQAGNAMNSNQSRDLTFAKLCDLKFPVEFKM